MFGRHMDCPIKLLGYNLVFDLVFVRTEGKPRPILRRSIQVRGVEVAWGAGSRVGMDS